MMATGDQLSKLMETSFRLIPFDVPIYAGYNAVIEANCFENICMKIAYQNKLHIEILTVFLHKILRAT